MADASVTNSFTAGGTIVANEVNANFTDLTTFLNTTGVHVYQAGTVNSSALADASVTGNKLAATAAAQRRVVHSMNGGIIAIPSTSQWLLTYPGNAGQSVTSGAASSYIFYMNPADYAVGTLTAKVSLRAACVTMAAGPDQQVTFGIHKVSAHSGSGLTLDSALTSVSFTPTTAYFRHTGLAADFTLSSEGFYAVVISYAIAPSTGADARYGYQVMVRAQ